MVSQGHISCFRMDLETPSLSGDLGKTRGELIQGLCCCGRDLSTGQAGSRDWCVSQSQVRKDNLAHGKGEMEEAVAGGGQHWKDGKGMGGSDVGIRLRERRASGKGTLRVMADGGEAREDGETPGDEMP